MNKTIFLYLVKIEKCRIFRNLPLVNLSMLDILEIDVITVISPVLRIIFAKIHMDNEVAISMTLLFSKMLSLIKIFH